MADKNPKDFSTPVGRWAGLGPYYAMFPLDFAFEVVRRYSSVGDGVLDPFAGRGSSIFAAASQERIGYGIEINPVGWLYGRVKLHPATRARVLCRLQEMGKDLPAYASAADDLPEFFSYCYCEDVRRFLLKSRTELAWKTSRVDATLMSLILVYLHGKTGSALSNQMRQGKAMSPDYSVRWWTERGLVPPNLDAVEFLKPRINWRYAKGKLTGTDSRVFLGNSIQILPRLANAERRPEFKLLFTSPPYCGITNYHYDQWLRLWMLGGPSRPGGGKGEHRGKFDSQADYRSLLTDVFSRSARLLAPDAVVYVRTDAREFTLETTKEVLVEAFPGKRMEIIARPASKTSQTILFGDKTEKPGEVDVVLT